MYPPGWRQLYLPSVSRRGERSSGNSSKRQGRVPVCFGQDLGPVGDALRDVPEMDEIKDMLRQG